MLHVIDTISVFLLCILLAGIMIPQILLISFRKRLFDDPDARKIHTSRVPRLGGIAFVPVIFFSIALMLGIKIDLGYTELLNEFIVNVQCVSFCFCALLIIYLVGMADDLIGVRYRAKFAVQIICATMLIAGGIGISNFHGFLGVDHVSDIVMWITTIGLAVFIMNAINLIDGIDGLASGLSSVAAIFYGIIFYMCGEYLFAMLAAGTLGVLVPFFYYNVFGNPAKRTKIFMGDSGSLTIGLILCVLSFKLMSLDSIGDFDDTSLLVASMSPLVIPCFDVVRVFFIRIHNGRSPFLPDKNHIHHKLMSLGMSQRATMLSIVGSSIAFTLFNTILSVWINLNLIILIDACVFFLGMFIIQPKINAQKHEV